MALTKMGDFTVDFTALPSKISGEAELMKTRFNSRSDELKTVVNALIDALGAVTNGASGADNIGMTVITETGAAATVQTVVEALITRLKAVTDSASGADLIGMTAITETGANATVQSVIEALITALKAVTDGGSGADLIGMTAITETGAAATVQAVIEALITRLKAVTDSGSGADLVGMTVITETGTAATVQAVIEALITRLKAVTDSVSGADLIGATAISGLTGTTVQAQMESLKGYVDTHESSDDHDGRYFTEDELGSTTDGSSGADRIGATTISGVSGNTVQAQMESIKGLITAGGISELSEDESPQLGGELDQNSHTIGGAEYDNGNSGTSKTIDWKKGNHQKVTMTGNCTFTFTAPTKPCMLSLRFINDGTAGRTITLPAIKWPGGTAPTWTKLANAVDILSLFYDGTNYYGQAGLAFATPS